MPRDDVEYPNWYKGPGSYSGVNYNPNWQGYHKGTIGENGQVHVWPVKTGGYPHHDEMGIAPINGDALADFIIENGQVYGSESDILPERYRRSVLDAVPGVRCYTGRRQRDPGTMSKHASDWFHLAMPYDPERDSHWWGGLCGEYAMALKQRHPELRYGFHYDPNEILEEGDIGRGWRHAFVHDDQYAYDIGGRHPLPYEHPRWQGVYNQTPEDMDEHYIFDSYFDPEMVDAAHEHIDQYGDPTTDAYNPPKHASESLLPISMQPGCPRCHARSVDDETGQCTSCGYTIPYDGHEIMQGYDEHGPVPGYKAVGWGHAMDDSDLNRADLGEPHWGHWGKHAYEDSPLPCPNCHATKGGILKRPGNDIHLHCQSCGYTSPQIGWDDPDSFAEAPFNNEWVNQDIVTSPDKSPEYIDPSGWNFGPQRQGGKMVRVSASLPSEPGTGTIPDGTLRLFHYTSPDYLDSIRQHGLLYDKGRGDSGTGVDEPSKGVWASTRIPKPDVFQMRPVVEYWAHPSQISRNAEHYWDRDPVEWSQGYRHVIMNGDVPPNQFVAVHEPWHSHYRYMMDSYPNAESVAQHKMTPDSFDWALDPKRGGDPELGKAIQEWKNTLWSKDSKEYFGHQSKVSAPENRLLNVKQIAHLYGVYPSAVSNWRSRSYLNFPEQAQPGLWSHIAIQNWAEGRNMSPAADIEEVMAVPPGKFGPKGPRTPPFDPNMYPPTHLEPYGDTQEQEQPWEGRKRNLQPLNAWSDQWGEGADPMDTINPPYGTVWGSRHSADEEEHQEHPEHQERQRPTHPRHPVLTPYPELKHPKPPKPQEEVKPPPEPKHQREPTERNPWIHDRGVRAKISDLSTPMGFGDMYHVSPRRNREKILNEGLRGYDRGRETDSPWEYTWDQPPGNYLFDNPEDAHDYIYNVHSRKHPLPDEQGDFGDLRGQQAPWSWEDRMESPEPPEEFHTWPDEDQEDWYDNAEYKERTDDPHGYDIYRIQSHGLPMGTDPESYITNQRDSPGASGAWDLGRIHDVQNGEAHDPWGNSQELSDWGHEPRRYYIPQNIDPSRIQLHQHVPSWNLNSNDYENRMDESHEREYPNPWSQIPLTERPMPGHESKKASPLTLNSPVPLDWMSVEHQTSKLAYGEQYDPTICQSCWHPMGPPKQVGGQWMNTCTYCGRSRLVPPNSPLLKQQQQNWPPYPDLLQEVGDNRPWIQAKMSFQAPNVTPEPTSSLPNGHHEQPVSDGPDVDQPQGVQVSADRNHLERSAHLNEGIVGNGHEQSRYEANDDDENDYAQDHDYRLAEKRAKSIIRLGQAQVVEKLAHRP